MNELVSIGIDFGARSVRAAWRLRGSEAKAIDGSLMIPSAVAFTADGRCLVGVPARRQRVTNPRQTAFAISRLVGRLREDFPDEGAQFPFEIVAGARGDARVRLRGLDFTPAYLAALIFERLKAGAEAQLGRVITDAVISVPPDFDAAQREATVDAAIIAGFDAVRIVDEPVAAILGCGLVDDSHSYAVLVLALGSSFTR